MTVFTFALAEESTDFLRLMTGKKESEQSGLPVVYGEIHGQPVAIFHTGVGGQVCRARLDRFLACQPCQLLVSSGFAGGVSSKLIVGDLLLAENFTSSELVPRVREALTASGAKGGRLITLDKVVESAADRASLALESSADAVDMESGVIHRACQEHGIPMISIRGISDSAAQPFPAPTGVLFDLERQRIHPPTLAAYLFCHPERIVSLIAFARRISHVRKKLTDALSLLASTFR